MQKYTVNQYFVSNILNWFQEKEIAIPEKKLLDWFKSDYCKRNNISEKTVAKPVQDYIRR